MMKLIESIRNFENAPKEKEGCKQLLRKRMKETRNTAISNAGQYYLAGTHTLASCEKHMCIQRILTHFKKKKSNERICGIIQLFT